MKILIYGAGPLGSVFASQLQQGGHDVSILARGQRLADLREYGIVLENFETHKITTTKVNVVEKLATEDTYDLVLVIMRKNNALDILPILAANKQTPNVLFLMNNAAGPDKLVEALGQDRVLMGFPMAAGHREGHIVQCSVSTEEEPGTIPIGEAVGGPTERTRMVAEALAQAPGYEVEILDNMDAWLKTHVALLMPALAPALYMCGTDNYRFARTRDAVVLTVRGIREAFKVLHALDIPILPTRFRPFEWIPEPLLVWFLQRLMSNEKMEIALVKHANAARDEMKHLADEFMVLARQSGVPTPVINRLYAYMDPATPLMPDGSDEIPLDWSGVWVALAGLGGVVGGIVLLRKMLLKR